MGHESKVGVGDLALLLDLVSRVAESHDCSTSEAVQLISRMLTPEPRPAKKRDKRERALLAEFVGRIRRLRLRRNELVGAPLFRDPAWDMLLELYAAHESGRRVSVSSLCYASGVPPTTALRQIARLEKFGLIVREGDRRDSRRQFIVPTAKAIQGVSDAVAQLLHHSQILDPGASDPPADPRPAAD